MVAAEVRADGLFRAPAGDERVSFLSRDDLAGAAATVLVEPGHSGAVLSLTGDDALSYRDVARLLAQATGRPVEYVDEEPSSYRARIGTLMPPSMADAFVAIWRTIREGWLAPVHPHMASLGRAPMSAAAWLTESKTLFVA